MRSNNQQRLAVFDIDGTLFRSSLLIEFNKGLMAEGFIAKRAVTKLLPDYFAWRDRKGTYDAYLNSVVDMHAGEIKSKSQKEAKKIARHIFNKHKDRLYRYTRDSLARLQKTHYTIAISGSPSEMVSLFAKHHGFDEYFATVYEVDKKGKYTGEVSDRRPIGMKPQILEDVIEHRNLTLRGSWGFGDTENDEGILSMVDNPIAMNPSSGLYKVATKNDWKIVVERKDMMYEF